MLIALLMQFQPHFGQHKREAERLSLLNKVLGWNLFINRISDLGWFGPVGKFRSVSENYLWAVIIRYICYYLRHKFYKMFLLAFAWIDKRGKNGVANIQLDIMNCQISFVTILCLPKWACCAVLIRIDSSPQVFNLMTFQIGKPDRLQRQQCVK